MVLVLAHELVDNVFRQMDRTELVEEARESQWVGVTPRFGMFLLSTLTRIDCILTASLSPSVFGPSVGSW